MSALRIVTVHGELVLGAAPATRIPCTFCGMPAQVVADHGESHVCACAECAVDALVVAANLAATPGARS